MPRLAANLSMMFNEVAFLDRFEAAAQAGFKGVEFLFPYDVPAAEIRKRLDDYGLAHAYASARTLRLADGPDEVHRNAIAKLELGKYAANPKHAMAEVEMPVTRGC